MIILKNKQILKDLELGDVIEFENINGKSLAKYTKDKTLVLADGNEIHQTLILTFLDYVTRDYNNGKHRYICIKKEELF